MTKPNLIIICLVIFSFHSFSQKHELGKVTIEELKEKACAMDTSAVAAALFEVGLTKFEYSESSGFKIITECMVKIKIYTKEGYSYANKSIRYFTGSNPESVDISNAATYNLVNGKIEKTKLGSDGIFIEKEDRETSLKKITMPNVKEGSIIEFKYTIMSSYFGNFRDWQFQRAIPVLYSEYVTYIPEFYIYNPRFKGSLAPKVDSEKNQKTLNFTSKERHSYVSTRFDTESWTFFETKSTYSLENIPALKDEAFVNNINNYKATVLHELAGTRYPNSPFKNFTTDWETVVKKIYDSEYFGDELKKTGYFERDLDALLVGTTSLEEKAGKIFSYVKYYMNWDEYSGIYCDDGVKKAYQDKKGNSAEINLILTAMLRYAGFEANPVILSTRANGIALYPSRSAYNNVIVGLELNNGIVLMDATNKFSIPNILPIRNLNWFGRIIRKDGSSTQINLMPESNSKDVINIMGTINDKGEVSGKIRDQYFDYNAFVFRQKNNAVSKDNYMENLEKEHQGLEISDYEVQNSTDLGKPIIENYSFITTNSVEMLGDKIYLSPFLFFAKTENPFKQETREYPIDLIYPNQDKFNVTLTIPDGYIVEVLPTAKAVSMSDNLANFKYNIISNGNQIQLQFSLDMNQAIIGSEYYDELKAFYKEIINKQTEKVVLKKV